MSDQHPVQWLVESLTPEVYAPMHDWLEHVLESNVHLPKDATMPDRGWAKYMAKV